MSDLMHVATITSAFGIKGQVKVHLFLENTEIFEVGAEFFYKNKKLTLTAITFVKSDFH
jgi:ribosomal 30S subunit maturation factor RimM